MVDCDQIKPAYGEIIHPLTAFALARVGKGYSTHDGGVLSASGTPDMKVNMALWHGKIAHVYTAVSAGYATADTQDATNDRLDIVYLSTGGIISLHKGTAAAVYPVGTADWKEFELPRPADATLPDGVILGIIHVRSTANGGGAIENTDIWMFTAFDTVRITGEESNEAPDGARVQFTFDNAFISGTEVLKVDGITQIRGASRAYQATPASAQIDFNSADDAPQAGSVVTLDYDM